MRRTLATVLTLATLLIVTIVLPAGAVADGVEQGWEFLRVSIVWPYDESGAERPVAESTLVNVSIWPAGQVRCAKSTTPWVLLGGTRDNEFASVGQPRDAVVLRTVDGVTFPSLPDYRGCAAAGPPFSFTSLPRAWYTR